jgi:hypothetical protein
MKTRRYWPRRMAEQALRLALLVVLTLAVLAASVQATLLAMLGLLILSPAVLRRLPRPQPAPRQTI